MISRECMVGIAGENLIISYTCRYYRWVEVVVVWVKMPSASSGGG